MELIIFNLVIVTGVIAFVSSNRTVSKRGWISSIIFALTLMIACLSSGVLLVTTPILLIVWLCLPLETSQRRRLQINLGVTAVVTGLLMIPGVLALTRLKVAEEKFPIVSLQERMKFESQTLADPKSAISIAYASSRKLSDTVSTALSRMDDEYETHQWVDRNYKLRSLHEDKALTFAQASGFGFGRMTVTYFGDGSDIVPYELPSLPELPADEGESFLPFDGGTIRKAEPKDDSISKEEPVAGDAESIGKKLYFASNANQFVPTETTGYVPGKQRAAGFVSHGFIKVPELKHIDQQSRHWELVRLELVSLLKFKEPRVYVSKELPQMEKLRSVPTRPLDVFELGALAKLWRDEDVVVEEQTDRIRMLGSLRALTVCINCHSAKRGQLLGAFSYELRLRPAREPQGTESDK